MEIRDKKISNNNKTRTQKKQTNKKGQQNFHSDMGGIYMTSLQHGANNARYQLTEIRTHMDMD